MPEYLIIGGKDENSALSALAVAADIAAAKNAQTDIATSPKCAPLVRLGKTPRRVVEVNAAPSGVSWEAVKNAPSGGLEGMLSFARRAAQTAASAAMKNFGQYRELAENLRLVRYDAVLDLDADAAGLLAARIASAEQICGFAAENIPDAAPGASLLYHDSRAVSKNLSRCEQCRRLAADIFRYTPPSAPEWDFIDAPIPADMPAPPFILLGGDIPEPFMEILRETELPLYAPAAPADILAAARECKCAVGGDGVFLAAAAGARAMFIGGDAHSPPKTQTTESPSALREAIAELSPHIAEKKSASKESSAAEKSAAPENPASSAGGLHIKR